jgi:hypothetical protein
MEREFAKACITRTPRRATALLLALILNVALVPCSMALEVVEQGHDCCPPELRLDAADCCLLDDAVLDTRCQASWEDESAEGDLLGAVLLAAYVPDGQAAYLRATGPPGPPARAIPIHKLNCVYLK